MVDDDPDDLPRRELILLAAAFLLGSFGGLLTSWWLGWFG